MPDVFLLPPLSVTVARRRVGALLDPELRERVQQRCGIEGGGASVGMALREGASDHESIWSIGPSPLLAVLELVGRDRSLVAVVWLTQPRQRKQATGHALRKARGRSDGLWVARPAVAAPALVVADGMLSLHLATLRHRTPNQWRAIDARRRFPAAAEAADHLGCSRQSLSQTLTRANVKVTDRTRLALEALLVLTSSQRPVSESTLEH
jgi:hypothetical protein